MIRKNGGVEISAAQKVPLSEREVSDAPQDAERFSMGGEY